MHQILVLKTKQNIKKIRQKQSSATQSSMQIELLGILNKTVEDAVALLRMVAPGAGFRSVTLFRSRNR